MIRFPFDQHMLRIVAEALRERGVDVVMAAEVGLQDAEDLEHFRSAREAGRVIVTRDADFVAIGQDMRNHPYPGIIRQIGDASVGDLVLGLWALSACYRDSDLANKVEWLGPGKLAELRSIAESLGEL